MSNPVFEPSYVVNEELLLSPPCAFVAEQLRDADVPNEAEKTAGAEDSGFENPLNIVVDAGKVTNLGVVDVSAGNPQTPKVVAQDSEKGKSSQEIPVTASPSMASGFMPENSEKVSAEDQGSFSDADKSSPIRPYETLGDYNYRTYSEKNASKIHVPIWNLKKGDTFSDWRVCRDWLQGTFPPGEIKFQEGRLHDQTYHAYLEESASYTSTTHRIKKVAKDENRAAHLRAKLEADQAKFEKDRRTEEWSVADWKRKAEAEASLLSEERKNWKKICEKDNAEKMGLRNVIHNLKAEEQLKKDLKLTHTEKAETSRRLAETEEKLENSETARATEEIELVPLKSDMTLLKERGIASVFESVLNSEELDKMVVRLVVAARNDGYAQGKSATHGVNTDAALAAMKTEFNNSQLPVMDRINVALQFEDHVAQLKEIFPDGENEDEDLA
ncbi:hypothetical protein Hanom_Chr01g00051541 [Helianthus anomalus]